MPGQVWVISELYYPEDAATGHYMTGIAEGLAQEHSVNVICAQPNYAKRGMRAPVRETHNSVRIERCWATRLDKNNFVLKAINVLSISLSIFFMALSRIRRGDVVLVVTNPPLLPFVVAAVCRMRGARCVLRIDDVYPEAMIHAGVVRPGGVAARAIDWLTGRLYLSVDRIVVLGRDMGGVVTRKLGERSNRVVVIPNWADLGSVVPEPRFQNTLLAELGLIHKFVVEYAGNIGPLQDIENLLTSALRLREVEDIHFLFIGSGKMLPWLTQAVKEAGLTNLTILGQRPRSDQSSFLNACDTAIVSLVPGMAGVGVPSRMYNVMAAGKPVIAAVDSDSELALVVREEQVGWIVPPGQPERIAEAILEARAHPQRLVEMGTRARSAAEAKYSSRRVLDFYRELLGDLDGAQP
ncbi:MAG: glycosyltransferase family 4 protein [Anaerolineae bacterium]|nr:glycosyltransferase family 4 protein [Anaerolineae bacterium]